jgi:hypothetical protein
VRAFRNAGSQDSIVVVVGGRELRSATLVGYHTRLTAAYGLRARLAAIADTSRGFRTLRAALGTDAGSFYAIVVGADSVAFVAPFLISLDEHRQLMERLAGAPRAGSVTVSLAPDDWSAQLRAMRVAVGQDTIAGDAFLAGSSTIVVADADCSECRLRDHMRRIRSIASAYGPLRVLTSARHARSFADSMPAGIEIVVPTDRESPALPLSLVSRDVDASDPILITVVDGRVKSVRRLGVAEPRGAAER